MDAVGNVVRAPLIEMFWSIQGEGRHIGEAMGFLRVATCPLRCSYCDTPHSYAASSMFSVDAADGRIEERNPVTALRAAELARMLRPQSHRALPRLSITGGEPLVFPSFLRDVGALLRRDGWRIHLETAAIDPVALRACVEQVDHLSADYKLPATIGGADHGEAHAECCRIALARGATVDVKVVLTPSCTEASFDAALERLSPFADRVLLVLQPVTPCNLERDPLPQPKLLAMLARAQAANFDVRVLPQAHKALQVP
jgi:7-carboxy-7-deazaguanine synthase